MKYNHFFPIVYVRGYAGSQGEAEDTVADPYMGFNVGSTKLRQSWDGSITKHIFESPLIRLMKEYGYSDAYLEGSEIERPNKVSMKSIWIYRYYEPVSEDLGEGKRPEMEIYAEELGDYLQKIRSVICGNNQKKHDEFKVYLVAHSMGGLVVRCWLQNLRFKEDNPVNIEKVFTYATPHKGIDFRGIGNIPKLIKINNTENFQTDRMRQYLKLPKNKPIHSLNNKFPEDRFFSLIGTNSKDYTAVAGLSSKLVGPLSDGLVQIKNASVKGTPRSYVHRAHSGHYGIVNSEEGYQNLKRFFFGDFCVKGNFIINKIHLPKKIEQAKKKGKTIRAAYHLEVVTKVRDARWDMYRRTVDEKSAIYINHEEIENQQKTVRLFSSFLSKDSIIKNSKYMGFAINIGLLAPEYVVDNRLFFDDYYQGNYIFNDQLKILIKLENGNCVLKYQWAQADDDTWTNKVHVGPIETEWLIKIPYTKPGNPGIEATLELVVSPH